jgi:hypothetical protein
MQHLLDFVHDHLLDEHLYCVVPSEEGDLELSWRRQLDPQHWEVRRARSDDPADLRLVPRAQLLATLELRGADLGAFERELRASVAVQIVLASQLLVDARSTLGDDTVEAVLRGHREFARELVAAVSSLTAPRLTLHEGAGARTDLRTGHLALVR